MSTRSTWNWFLIAAALFAFIVLVERHWRKPPPGPQPVLPGFKPAAVTAVQVYPSGRFEIRAQRIPTPAASTAPSTAGSTWQLTKPVAAPAQGARIEALLGALEQLKPSAPPLTPDRLRDPLKADSEFGLDNPQLTLVLQENGAARHLRFGALSAPGDQVFVRVVGDEHIYAVDARLLALIPRDVAEWRDTTFADVQALHFDRLLLTHAGNVIEFQRESPGAPWRMNRPLRARVNQNRLLEALQQLHALRVAEFVTDDPNADLDAYGLQPADVELTFARGTNILVRLFFGRTNALGHVFARRHGLPGVVALPAEPLIPWRRASFDDFRDRHLIALTPLPAAVEVRGEEPFTLLAQTNGWRITPQTFPIDPAWADEALAALASFEVEFHKNAATEPDLRAAGLMEPARLIRLLAAPPTNGVTNVLAELRFGLTNDQRVLVARADEDSIYALRLADFERLPWAAWQLRDRHPWRFSVEEVARVASRQAGRAREWLRVGTNAWTLAPGSQGFVNSFAVEETVHRLGELAATLWVLRVAADAKPEALAAARQRFGLGPDGLSVTCHLKSGAAHLVEFGNLAPSGYPYAAVTLGGELWVFEFPRALYELVQAYLTPGAASP
ncbi:MAG: DUF4340 domain-containing protein [Verrucomicrobiae bacterium]|nr:DUF4340 domain-containing protein [Verrucomicrobiae bacterium]MDW8308388.1 DUF4340 domain-containing protein [Verrucomicrobiales bacterium]